MSGAHYEGTDLAGLDQLITEIENKIDAQLELIEQVEARGESTEPALIAFAALVDTLDKLAQRRLIMRKTMAEK
jgi:acid stress-induced BolA-like protein IbaG/YrbA